MSYFSNGWLVPLQGVISALHGGSARALLLEDTDVIAEQVEPRGAVTDQVLFGLSGRFSAHRQFPLQSRHLIGLRISCVCSAERKV